jgi:hypothetical protein
VPSTAMSDTTMIRKAAPRSFMNRELFIVVVAQAFLPVSAFFHPRRLIFRW